MTQRELTRLAALQRFEAGDLTQAEIARQLQLSVRQIKRLWRRYRSEGAAGVTSRRRGRPSNNRTDPALLARALELYRDHYADFGPTFASEKLLERRDLRIDHEVLRRGPVAAHMDVLEATPQNASATRSPAGLRRTRPNRRITPRLV